MSSAATANLPLTETLTPADQAELLEIVRKCVAEGTAIYPLGGETSLDLGLPARTPGIGISLTRLCRVIDYPAADMTITVEAGITMAALAEILAAKNQRLPIDVPEADRATLGGLIATNHSGPRRFGYGTLRDYVIGISAVDGHGTPFKAGGRVVKNVAGYDFCKLLTGSLGTLAVITQATLKVRPLPEAQAILVCDVPNFARAEELLVALITSRTTPVAVELLAGPAWRDDADFGPGSSDSAARVVVGFEGTKNEVEWLAGQLSAEWREQGVASVRTVGELSLTDAWRRLTDFSVAPSAPLVVKMNVLPSKVCELIPVIQNFDQNVSIQAHAGNGIILARFAKFSAADAGRLLIHRLQPAAVAAGGQAMVVSSAGADELTRQAIWGQARGETAIMRAVKKQFDPQNLLNPGRFVYGT
jgi:glycolate oxidase FAD binding subunit